jgi:serine/threonine protein kinase
MVFPYMDHDLAGLLENERVKLQPSHIKLYMKQLLEGTEYMHRVCRFIFLAISAFAQIVKSKSKSESEF